MRRSSPSTFVGSARPQAVTGLELGQVESGAGPSAVAESLRVEQRDRWLIARFAAPHEVLSWAIINGGRTTASEVAWLQVTEDDLRPSVDPREFFLHRLAAENLSGAVGLLTSRRVDRYSDVTQHYGDGWARCIATVGMGNVLRAGDLPGVAGRIGTINLLVQLHAPLTREAQLEALALAAEARTLAVLESGIASRRSGLPATGTGTDCIAIASPIAPARSLYAGKHTALGHLVGAAVHQATTEGILRWKEDQA
jgi:adenosylcobinamide amidohydrolase